MRILKERIQQKEEGDQKNQNKFNKNISCSH